MSHVTFTNVTKTFGKVVALDKLNLAIEEGEFVSLLGPSGSGKTTTLNLLAGLLPIGEGEIRIAGKRVNELSPDKRDIAMVFQNYALYPHMTIHENIAFPLKAKGRRLPPAEADAKVRQIAAMLGVEEMLARYPKELSGGQQQRVALGRAMVRDPKVFLLDEPLSNLDARLRIRMRQDIKALHARIGSTIVYVTHDQAEAMSMSSRIAVFAKGRLQQFASPAEIYNRPANLFVAGFVGEREINQFPGVIHKADGSLRLEAGGHSFDLGADPQLAAAAGRKVITGVRAESLEIAPAPGPGLIPAEVLLSELIGPDLILQVRAGELTLDCRADPRLSYGKTVYLRPRTADFHIFDPDSTVNLRVFA